MHKLVRCNLVENKFGLKAFKSTNIVFMHIINTICFLLYYMHMYESIYVLAMHILMQGSINNMGIPMNIMTITIPNNYWI